MALPKHRKEGPLNSRGGWGEIEPYDKDPADFYKKYLKQNKDYFKIYTFTDF